MQKDKISIFLLPAGISFAVDFFALNSNPAAELIALT